MSLSAPSDLAAYWMPYTANRFFQNQPRMVSRAKDMHYYTPDGRAILDGTAGLWCCNAGHSRQPIVDALAAQAAELDFCPPFQFGHPKAFAVARQLADLAPGDLDHVFFTSSGSEAVDTSLKIALAYWNLQGKASKVRLVGRERGYHGVGFGGTSVGGIGGNRKMFGALLSGIDHLPHTYNREKQAFSTGEPEWGAHLADDLERLVTLHDASTIAAVIVEPMAGSTGVLPAPKGYLKRLRELCDKHSILLIFDEVITGFGRLGYAFAAERYGVVPDMICFAKGVAGGAAPAGGVLVRENIHASFMQGPEHSIEFFHGYTYGAHPLSIAAMSAALDMYRKESLFERARQLEPYWAEAIMSLRSESLVEDIRPIGLAAGIDLTPIAGVPGRRGFNAMNHAFHTEGLMIRGVGDTIAVCPPLIISEDQIDELVAKLKRTIQAVAAS